MYLISPSIRLSRVKKMLGAAGSMWGLVRSKKSCRHSTSINKYCTTHKRLIRHAADMLVLP